MQQNSFYASQKHFFNTKGDIFEYKLPQEVINIPAETKHRVQNNGTEDLIEEYFNNQVVNNLKESNLKTFILYILLKYM